MSIEVALILVIGIILFVGFLIHSSYRNGIIEIKNLLSEVPGDIKNYNNGLKDAVASKVSRAKPVPPEDLDELSEILIKMLKKGWVLSYNWDLAVHYYQIAQLASVGGWQAEWAEENGVCYIRLVKKGR